MVKPENLLIPPSITSHHIRQRKSVLKSYSISYDMSIEGTRAETP